MSSSVSAHSLRKQFGPTRALDEVSFDVTAGEDRRVGDPFDEGTVVAIDNDDIGGVVSGPSGPEAGAWVIAETTDLPTKFAKIVVTDQQGRYAIPDLPKGAFSVLPCSNEDAGLLVDLFNRLSPTSRRMRACSPMTTFSIRTDSRTSA